MGTVLPFAKRSLAGQTSCLFDSIRKSEGVRLAGVLAVLLLMLAALGCNDITSQRGLLREVSGNEKSQIPFGESGRVDTFEVAVMGVRATNARDDAIRDSFLRIPDPADGNIYLLVDVNVKNVGEKSEVVSSRQQINLFDAEQNTQTWSLISISKGSIDGKINPDRERRGELVWEVSEDAEGLNMVFGETVFAIGDVSDFRAGDFD